MIRYFNLIPALLSVSIASPTERPVINHNILASTTPDNHSIAVIDTLSIPLLTKDYLNDKPLGFYLNSKLIIDTLFSVDGQITYTEMDSTFSPSIWEEDSLAWNDYKIARFIKLDLPAAQKLTLVIKYHGMIFDSLNSEGKPYPKGFEYTTGIIDNQGIYLPGAAFWTVYFPQTDVKFMLNPIIPQEWSSISQGDAIRDVENKIVGWSCQDPMNEIYLIAGPYKVIEEDYNGVSIQMYTYEEDPELTGKYTVATKQYLDMYNSLIGQYPFSKFALVENFWETGFGMPSFTLLGKTVIRLPFIVYTSYGHEILHNWWGNSVYVDYKSGNWCEGLTTYLADHLFKESKSIDEASQYRFETLAAYKNYVKTSEDFPLTQFRGRYSAETQAVGYGKTLFVFHMLYQMIGEQAFYDALKNFYQDYKFKYASWMDLIHEFEKTSQMQLSDYFHQWVEIAGAPEISLKDAQISESEGAWKLDFSILQTEPVFNITLPVMVKFADKDTLLKLNNNSLEQGYTFTFTDKPKKLIIDPSFDVFRKLDRTEIPAKLGQTMGSDSIKIFIPSKTPTEFKEIYQSMITQWFPDIDSLAIINTDKVNLEDYKNYCVFIFGNPDDFNQGSQILGSISNQANYLESKLIMGNNVYPANEYSFLLSGTHPFNPDLSWSLFYLANKEFAMDFSRKIPHYSSYSYVIFKDKDKVTSGTWEVINSPLVRQF
jgi:aminopeptidase N